MEITKNYTELQNFAPHLSNGLVNVRCMTCCVFHIIFRTVAETNLISFHRKKQQLRLILGLEVGKLTTTTALHGPCTFWARYQRRPDTYGE